MGFTVNISVPRYVVMVITKENGIAQRHYYGEYTREEAVEKLEAAQMDISVIETILYERVV